MRRPLGAQDDFLAFWESKATCTCKKLSEVAQGLLGVSAASASSERACSLAGCIVDERRIRLSGDGVDGLLFIHGIV
jgi:hAT family C-terminal dimerisation region